MPQALSFPGVYIEEVPSGVRTIVGVPTSVAAFVGRTSRGQALEPVDIFSFPEFEREFGGLWAKSSLGYAVRDFYLNGGGRAVIVRTPVTEAAGSDTTTDTTATLTLGGLDLVASAPGAWGNNLRGKIDHDGLGTAADATAKLFNLTITEVDTNGAIVLQEKFKRVTTDDTSPRRVDAVLKSSSKLARVSATFSMTGAARPTVTTILAADKLKVGTAATSGSDATHGLSDVEILDGLEALAKADIFNILVIPPLDGPAIDDPGLSSAVVDQAIATCDKGRAMLILDPPTAWASPSDVTAGLAALGWSPSKNSALYFPRIRKTDATLADGKLEVDFAPSGAVAGVWARTDGERGVWKAPAGLDAILRGAPKLSALLTDDQNGLLNPEGVNCLRVKTGPARVIWGARTRFGDDDRGSEWKYIPIRRLAYFIEESLFRATQWVVFEPNDEPLWASIRLNVGSFMHGLFRQGAFQGGTPRDAYFVKCDKDTNPQADIDRGIVNIVVGFAPLKPAEFVVIKLQQIAGTIET